MLIAGMWVQNTGAFEKVWDWHPALTSAQLALGPAFAAHHLTDYLRQERPAAVRRGVGAQHALGAP